MSPHARSSDFLSEPQHHSKKRYRARQLEHSLQRPKKPAKQPWLVMTRMSLLKVRSFRNVSATQAYIISGINDLELDSLGQGNSAFAAYDSKPPPPPNLKSNGVIAMDITEQFVHAAQRMPFPASGCKLRADCFKGLELGQLVKDPYLTLFESVGALEVSQDISVMCTLHLLIMGR